MNIVKSSRNNPCYIRKKNYQVALLVKCISNVMGMMMLSNGNIFRVTDPLRGKFTGHRTGAKPLADPMLDQ